MEILLFDRSEKQIGRLLPELVSPTEIEDLSGEHRLLFSYPSDADWAESIAEGHLVACQDMDRAWQLYEIVQVRDQIGTVEAICDHAYYALSGMEFVSATCEGSATLALDIVLAGTGWEAGTVEIQASRSVTFQHVSPLAAVTKIVETWGGELRFRVAVSGAHITGRYVDLLTRRGDVTGKRFEFGRDIRDIDITLDRTGVVTALYGWGQGEGISEDGEDTERLTMADAEWIEGEEAELHPGGLTSPAPCDKPLGQLWVGDEAARLAYGRHDLGTGQYRHIFGEYDSQAQSPQALLWETWRQLQKRNEPLVNIKATVADLEQVKVVGVQDAEGPTLSYSRSSVAYHPVTGAEVGVDTPIFMPFSGEKMGLLVEEGTENKTIQSVVVDVPSDWLLEQIDDYTFKISAKVDSPGSVARSMIAHMLGSYSSAINEAVVHSGEVIDRSVSGGGNIYLAANGFGTIEDFGVFGNRVFKIIQHTATWLHYQHIRVQYPQVLKAGDYLIFSRMQLEVNSYPTTFTPGTRANPTTLLTLPAPLPEEFGVGVWFKPLHTDEVDRSQVLILLAREPYDGLNCIFIFIPSSLNRVRVEVIVDGTYYSYNIDDVLQAGKITGIYLHQTATSYTMHVKRHDGEVVSYTRDSAPLTGLRNIELGGWAMGNYAANAVFADFVLHDRPEDIDPEGYLSAIPGGGGE